MNVSLKKELLSKLNREGKEIYSFDEILKFAKVSRNFTWKVVSELENMGRLVRLEKGKYLYVPEGFEGNWSGTSFLIASHLVKPYALSYWTALNYWHYTEQIPRTIFVQTIKRKLYSKKEISGVRYKFITLKPNKFFGLTTIWERHHKIQITDKEKTIVDCLDHPQYCGGILEATKGIYLGITNKEIGIDKLFQYAKRLGNKTVLKRLGFIVEALELTLPPSIIEKIQKEIGKGFSLLDPLLPNQGKYNSRWQLRINL
ncbi:MAG: hypothetical protein ACE5WD_14575, partial [Candidatus Aminicenantia bacterium]